MPFSNPEDEMVKLDPKQDYYSALELPDNCSTEDVKRQFRKLGRQCILLVEASTDTL